MVKVMKLYAIRILKRKKRGLERSVVGRLLLSQHPHKESVHRGCSPCGVQADGNTAGIPTVISDGPFSGRLWSLSAPAW